MKNFLSIFTFIFLALGSLSAQSLQIAPVHEGDSITFDITGGDPDANITICYSLFGSGPVDLGVVTLDLSPPVGRLSPFSLSAAGDGSYGPIPLPSSVVAGTQVWFQGVQNTQSGSALTTTNLVDIIIEAPLNQPPVAVNDSATVDENDSVLIDVLANDYDPESDSFGLVSVSAAQHGVAFIFGDEINYFPFADYYGNDIFRYTVVDSYGGTSTARVNVTVVPVNRPPVATNLHLGVAEDGYMPFDLNTVASDPDGDLLDFTTTDPEYGDVIDFVYYPDPDYFGTDSFMYTATDPSGLSATADVTVDVSPIDDPLICSDSSITTDEETSVSFDLSMLAYDPDGYSNLTFSAYALNGTVTITGSIGTYTPTLDFCGTDSIYYTASNGVETCTSTVTVTVNCINDAPVCNDGTLDIDEDTIGTIDLSALVSDIDGDALTFSAVGGQNGTVTIAGSVCAYTPNLDFCGVDSFTYTVSDGIETCSSVINVTVNCVNDPPTYNGGLDFVIDEDNCLYFDPLDYFTDVDDDVLTFSITDGANGFVTMNGGIIEYCPMQDYCSFDSFTITVYDGTHSLTTTVTIIINCINDAPVCNDGTLDIDEDTIGSIDLSTLVSDIDGDALTFSAGNGLNGTVTMVGSVCTYTPNLDFCGVDSFTYTVSDGIETCSSVINVTVNCVNDAPVCGDGGEVYAYEDTDGIIDLSLLAYDPDGDALAFSAEDGIYGTVTINGSDCIYTPATDFCGVDSFSYTASDGILTCTSVIDVTVYCVNDSPICSDGTIYVDEDTAVMFDLSALVSDIDGDALTFTLSSAQYGTISLGGSYVNYTPAPDFCGVDSFTYTVSDGVDFCTATITVHVVCVNDPPIQTGDMIIVTDEDNCISINPLDYFIDPDDDALTVTLISDGAHGYVTMNGGGLEYCPYPDYCGPDSFTVEISDGVFAVQATVNITVNCVNDSPVCNDGSIVVDAGDCGSIDLLSLVSDVENDSLTFSIMVGGANGTASIAGSTLTYCPDQGFFGMDSIVFQVDDGTSTCTSTIIITVNDVNHPPVATDFYGHILADTIHNFDWTLQVSDPDIGDVVTLSGLTQPPNGFAADIGGGLIAYTPNPGYTGLDAFDVVVEDIDGLTASLIVEFNVIALPVLDMLPIASGTFIMGDHAGTGRPDESPVHFVSLDAFELGRYEVTNQQYADSLNIALTANEVRVEGGNVYFETAGGEKFFSMSQEVSFDGTGFVVDALAVASPVASVTWFGAAYYSNWLSGLFGLTQCYDETTWQCDFNADGLRLPTEAEAEYASRAGQQSPYYLYPWATDFIDFSNANYLDSGISQSTAIGSYAANSFGFYDVSGNVYEWCNDWYDQNYYVFSPQLNPAGPALGADKVIRGGGWNSPGLDLRSAARYSVQPEASSMFLGFRLATGQ